MDNRALNPPKLLRIFFELFLTDDYFNKIIVRNRSEKYLSFFSVAYCDISGLVQDTMTRSVGFPSVIVLNQPHSRIPGYLSILPTWTKNTLVVDAVQSNRRQSTKFAMLGVPFLAI
jgi:hypothetical protein